MTRCVPIDHEGPVWCFERCVDTFEIGEFSYMVRRDVWLAAVPRNTHGGMFDFLCIGCLEARFGRQLTAEDFPTDVPMNYDSRDWRSERLQARLNAGGSPGGGGVGELSPQVRSAACALPWLAREAGLGVPQLDRPDLGER